MKNPNKPGKVRVVNDAAAEFQGTGLNKNLVTGPDLLNSLTGVLTRFRRDPVAIAGDIEAMFHQVRVSDEDSDSLCFLWTDDIHSKQPPYILKMLVHIFGAKDSMTCCCYALQRTLGDHSHLMSALAYETILKSFYANDLLRSVATVEGGIELVRELMEVLKRTGFRITKFVSNSKEVLDSIPAEDVSPKASIHLDADGLERVLGAKWDIPSDTFTFTYNFIDAPSPKRGILKVTRSLFDWDTELAPDIITHWERWKKTADNVSCVRVPWCFYSAGISISSIQLHVFVDASELVQLLTFGFLSRMVTTKSPSSWLSPN